jgi:hypothetical protein
MEPLGDFEGWCDQIQAELRELLPMQKRMAVADALVALPGDRVDLLVPVAFRLLGAEPPARVVALRRCSPNERALILLLTSLACEFGRSGLNILEAGAGIGEHLGPRQQIAEAARVFQAFGQWRDSFL